MKMKKPIIAACLLLNVLMTGTGHARPAPGEVWREYQVAVGYDGLFRLGGKYAGGGENLNKSYPLAPVRVKDETLNKPIPFNVDLEHAIRAEVTVGVNKSHAGSHPLYVGFNDQNYHLLPWPTGVTGTGKLFHSYLESNISLSELHSGTNTFKFTNELWFTDPVEASKDNSQNLIYELILRVYYDAELKDHPEGAITQPVAGAVLDASNGKNPLIEATATGAGPIRVDFLGYYDDFDRRSAINWRQWHYRWKQYRDSIGFLDHLLLVDIIGSDATAPYSATWDMEWIPDQNQAMMLSAFLTDTNGIMTMLDPVGNITFSRPERSVELAKPYDTPNAFNTAQIKETGGPVHFDISGDLRLLTDAYLFFQVWPNGGNDEMGYTLNGVHQPTFDPGDFQGTAPTRYGKVFDPVQEIPLNLLREGQNDLWPDKGGEHGMEILWPGVGAYLAYDMTAAPSILDPLGDVAVTPGETALLRTRVGGVPEPTYSWECKLPGGNWEPVTGATESELQLSELDESFDGTLYRVTAQNGSGTVVSREAVLRVARIRPSFQANGAGQIVIEAENFDDSDKHEDQYGWQVMSEIVGYTGTGYIWNYYHETVAGQWQTAAMVDYRFRVPETGTYTPWLRVRGRQSGVTHSALIGFDGTENSQVEASTTVWQWVSAQEITLSIGEHTLDMMRKADGLFVDKIILSPEPTYIPSGNGPVESARDIVVDNTTRILLPLPSDMPKAGKPLTLTGSGLNLQWTLSGVVSTTATGETFTVDIPEEAVPGSQLHILLEGDEGAPASMTLDIDTLPLPLIETGGLVAWEAESWRTLDVRSGTQNWRERTDLTGYSGAGAMGTYDNDNTVTEWTNGPIMTYQVNFSTPGTYYVWVRYQSFLSTGDSIWFGEASDAAGLRWNLLESAMWVWSKRAATVMVDAAGIKTFAIVNREDGVSIDKVVLSNDSNFNPASIAGGLGPDESSHDLPAQTYEQWIAGYSWGTADHSESGDPDGDLLNNQWEQYLQTHPLEADPINPMRFKMVQEGGKMLLRWNMTPVSSSPFELRLLSSTNLATGFSVIQTLYPAASRNVLPMTTVENVGGGIQISMPAGQSQAFYRFQLYTPPPPDDPPTANAGVDQSVQDENLDGLESVVLNGAGSGDDNGIVSYTWKTNGVQIATGVSPTVSLPVGIHDILLEVKDDAGQTGTDTVRIIVYVPTVGGLVVEGSGSALAGGTSVQSAAFTASSSGAPGNYLVVCAVSETASVTAMTYGGAPMTLLHLVDSGTAAYIQYFGIATSSTSGEVSVTYSGNIWGAQIFGYTFLSGVDTANPVRAVATGINDPGTGSLSLIYSASASGGDLAIMAANKNNGTGSIAVFSPVDSTLINSAAGATFGGAVAVDAELPAGTYSTGITFTDITNREVGGGIIIAAE